MPDLWMPGATHLDIGDYAPCDGGPAKAISHITWDKNATAAKPADLVPYENLVSYFGRNTAGQAVAPHLLWDPFTGRVTQFYRADSRSKSLVDTAGGTRTNRAGSVVIQIEALFFPYCQIGGKTYARLVDTPCKGWPELHAWVKSWGVPDAWPMGRPTDFTPHRSESVWETRGGWYGHSQVPENDHQDPGSWPGFITPVQEDDVSLTADQAKQLGELHDALVPYKGWDYKGAGKTDAWAILNGIAAKEAANAAAITALAKALGDAHPDVDTATVVAAVQQAVADAVIKVDVSVTGPTPTA